MKIYHKQTIKDFLSNLFSSELLSLKWPLLSFTDFEPFTPNMWDRAEHWGRISPDYDRSYWQYPIRKGQITTNYQPAEIEGEVYAFACDGVTTFNTFRQKYGLFEIEANVPTNKGVRSALWMYGDGPGRYCEIDIMERDKGNKFKIAIHWVIDGQWHTLGPWNVKLKKGMHRYSLDWRKDYIKIYVDDRKVWQCTNKKILKYIDLEMWLVIYQGVIGLDAETPAVMKIDNVVAFL